jgi:hypothetical protein
VRNYKGGLIILRGIRVAEGVLEQPRAADPGGYVFRGVLEQDGEAEEGVVQAFGFQVAQGARLENVDRSFVPDTDEVA